MCYERLLLVKDNKTWEEALEHCRSLGDEEPPGWNHSYDLATLMTEDDITYARQKAQLASSNEVSFFLHCCCWQLLQRLMVSSLCYMLAGLDRPAFSGSCLVLGGWRTGAEPGFSQLPSLQVWCLGKGQWCLLRDSRLQ